MCSACPQNGLDNIFNFGMQDKGCQSCSSIYDRRNNNGEIQQIFYNMYCTSYVAPIAPVVVAPEPEPVQPEPAKNETDPATSTNNT
jgi:hypothetical protein